MVLAYQNQSSSGREILTLFIPKFEFFPPTVAFPNSRLVCLLVCDATQTPDSVITDLAALLVEKGLVYLCAWGPDCSRVHDLFDLTIVKHELEKEVELAVMTTWHADESLDDALWFMLNCAYHPDDTGDEAWACRVIIIVGNPDWVEQIHRGLADPC